MYLVRRALYEWFLNSHLMLAAVLLIAIWRHVPANKSAELYLLIGVGLWTIATVVHWAVFIFTNVVFGKPLPTAIARRLVDGDIPNQALVDRSYNVMQVDVTVPRPWRVKAGQSVFLSLPKLGVFTGLRGHPFMISWWERDSNGLTISLLVESRAGFTAKLDGHRNEILRAYIDGPFGLRHNFGEYGTVVMFATGIGIAGHLLYIRDLIRGYNECEVKTHRIRLAWAIEEESKRWSQVYMHSLTNSRSRIVGYALDGRTFG